MIIISHRIVSWNMTSEEPKGQSSEFRVLDIMRHLMSIIGLFENSWPAFDLPQTVANNLLTEKLLLEAHIELLTPIF